MTPPPARSAGRCLNGRALALAGALGWLAAGEAPAHQDILQHIAALDVRIADTPDAVLHARRADLYRRHREWDKALADYAAAARLAPDDPAIPIGRARVFLDSGAPRKALDCLAPVLAATPHHGSACLLQARAFANLGESEAAANAFERALDCLTQPIPDHYLEYADTLASANPPRLAAAIAVLDKGIVRLGALTSLHERALELERRAGLLKPALDRLRGLREKLGLDLPAWRLAEAEILSSLGRPAEAREGFHAALAALDSLPPARRATPALQEMKARTLAALDALNAAEPPATPPNRKSPHPPEP